MRLEKLSHNKFKIFLTFDDLVERGITRDDLWYDLPRVHQLFHDMMYEATDELGIELFGMLSVQVHLLQAQGMLIVVTQSDQLDEDFDDDYIEMKVTLDESKEMIFAFESFEDIIQVSQHLHHLGVDGGDVHYFEDYYYMRLGEGTLKYQNREHMIAIMSEFASPSTITSHRLTEYGNPIFTELAVQQIINYFY